MRKIHYSMIFTALLLCINFSSYADFLFYEVNGYLEDVSQTGPLTGYVVVNDIPMIDFYSVSYAINDFYFDGGDLGFFRGEKGEISYHQFDTYLTFEGYGIKDFITYDNEELNWGLGEEMIIHKLRPEYYCSITTTIPRPPLLNFTMTCINYPYSVPEPDYIISVCIGLLSIMAFSIKTIKV